jgi:hypothetical protein
MRLLFLVLIVAAAGALAAPSGHAQAPSASPASPATSRLSNEKLDQAAAAIARVAFLRQSYEHQLAQADPAEREKIAEQASGELAKAVNDQGLSVEEYNSIVDRARTDPDVRKKILDRLQPAQEERAPAAPSGRDK